MFTGSSPLGAYTINPRPGPLVPIPILADHINPDTGEITNLLASRTPVDGAVIEGFRVDRGSGPAVLNVGHTLRRIRHTDDSSLAEVPTRARDAVVEMERLGLVRFEGATTELNEEQDGLRTVAKVTDLTAHPISVVNYPIPRQP